MVALADDGDTFEAGDATVEAIHTPGRSANLVSDSLRTTGDGRFVESVARPDLEAGDDGAPDAARTRYETLQDRVLPLPDETLIGVHTSATQPSQPKTERIRPRWAS